MRHSTEAARARSSSHAEANERNRGSDASPEKEAFLHHGVEAKEDDDDL